MNEDLKNDLKNYLAQLGFDINGFISGHGKQLYDILKRYDVIGGLDVMEISSSLKHAHPDIVKELVSGYNSLFESILFNVVYRQTVGE